MRMLITRCAAALVLVPMAALADGLSYNYLQAGYVKVEPEEGDIDADGWAGRVSGLVSEVAYVFASYSNVETDDFTDGFFGTGSLESETITAGLGFRGSIAPSTDFNAEVAYVHAEISGNGDFAGSEDDNGFALGAGLRHLFAPQFEGGLSVDYVDVFDEDDTSFTVSGLFHVTPQFSIGAAYSISDDADGWTAGVRFNF